MAVGEQAEQDQLELLALADDCALDLVEQARAELGHAPVAPSDPLQGGHDAFERRASSIPGA